MGFPMNSDHGFTRALEDDERGPMTTEERTVWVYLVAVILTSGTYFAVILSRLRETPASEISWVVPLLWAMGLSIAGTIVGTILATIAAAIGQGVRGRSTEIDHGVDERDKEIKRYGSRKTQGVISVGLAGALALAMIDADTFWIGNFLFLIGTIGAIVETTVKIRAYRRGF